MGKRGKDVDVDKETLDELVALMQRDGLDRIRVRAGGVTVDARMSASAPTPAPDPAAAAPARTRGEAPAPDEAPPGVVKVVAPLVGVFYRSPAPGAKPFVEVGDEVAAGQTLCILEAMKLMNEIVSEHSGRVVRICAQDGQLVSLHQELFWIET